MNITEENMENRQQAPMFSDEFEHWEYRTDFINNINELSEEERTDTGVVKGSWEDKLLRTLRDLSPKDFENFCFLITQKMGIQTNPVLTASFPPNRGIDRLGYIIDLSSFRTNRIAITIKKLHADVTEWEIKRFQEVVSKSPADYGIYFATANFSTQAKQLAVMSNPPITMIDGKNLCKLVDKYKLHIDKDYKA